MSPTPGWYQDPSDPGQMRYWDGENWTAATGPMPRPRQTEPSIPDPVMAAPAPFAAAPAATFAPPFTPPSGPAAAAQPAAWPPSLATSNPYQNPAAGTGMGYPYGGAATPAWGPAPKPSRLTTRMRAALAAGVAIAIAAAVTVPLLLGSGKSALTKAFERSLLTPGQVTTLANQTFGIDTSKDNSSNDNSSSGCMDAMNNLASGKTRGEASTSLVSADHTAFVMEDLSNDTGNPQEFTQLRNTLQTCHSATFDGLTASLQLLPQPAIGGSDDTMSFEMSVQGAGRSLTFDFGIARFGDTIVMLAYGSADTSADFQGLGTTLLTAAVDNASSAIPQHHAA